MWTSVSESRVLMSETQRKAPWTRCSKSGQVLRGEDVHESASGRVVFSVAHYAFVLRIALPALCVCCVGSLHEYMAATFFLLPTACAATPVAPQGRAAHATQLNMGLGFLRERVLFIFVVRSSVRLVSEPVPVNSV